MTDDVKKAGVSLLDFATVCALVVAVTIGVKTLAANQTQEPRDRVIDDWEQYVARGERLGPSDAPVTIVEWGDYQCPGCRRLASILPTVLSQYDGQVQFLYRHWPLTGHDRAYDAARAAECAADQDRFWEMHDLINRETDWGRVEDLNAEFVDLARRAEVSDLRAYASCLESGAVDGRIEADIRAIRQIEARGTPTVLVNGVYAGSFTDSTKLVSLIDDALAKAR